jgi:hypothetical protein
MKTFFSLFLCLCFSFQGMASLPPLYNILRSTQGFDEKVETVSINFILKTPLESSARKEGKGVKVILARENGRVSAIQVIYDDQSFSDNKIIAVKSISDIGEMVMGLKGSDPANQLRISMYAYLVALGLNGSEYLSQAIFRISPDMERGDSLVNKEKRQLLLSYKNYLQERVKNKGTKIPNPLMPTGSEERAMVNRIMETPFYAAARKPELLRVNQDFLLFYKLDQISAYFHYDSHLLAKLDLGTNSHVGSLEMTRYRHLKNGAWAPSEIKAVLENQIEATFKVDSMNPATGKDFKTRLSEYQQKLAASKVRDDKIAIFPFL